MSERKSKATAGAATTALPTLPVSKGHAPPACEQWPGGRSGAMAPAPILTGDPPRTPAPSDRLPTTALEGDSEEEQMRAEFMAALKALGQVRRMPAARLSDRQYRARVRELQRQKLELLKRQ